MIKKAIFPNVILFILLIIISCFKAERISKIDDKFNNAVFRNPNMPIEKRVEDLLSKMTLEEKLGQMVQLGVEFLQNNEDITKFKVGALLNGANNVPEISNVPKTWVNHLTKYQNQALKTRLKIPLLYGIDALHGNALVKETVVFPHNIGMGCTNNPALAEKAARIIAEEIAGCGIHWTFAPCVAVPQDERWGRTYEGYSENPDIVKIMAEATVKGLQGNNFTEKPFVLATAKHFLGDGGTAGGNDRGDTVCDEKTLRKIHLQGYIGAIKQNVGSIMVSYSSWNGLKMHENKYLLTDVLKKELGFNGLLLSDYGGILEVSGTTEEKFSKAINSGVDMIMQGPEYPRLFRGLVNLVKNGSIPIERIDDAVRRILYIKFKMGLFENPYFDNEKLTNSIGSEEHKMIARQCVRESTVLLKNNNKILPLSKNLKRIHVSGWFANDIGNQCGGWTLKWQGDKGNIRSGTTILKGIKAAVSKSTKVTYSKDGKGAKGADVCIVVVGEREKPYAEWFGDSNGLNIYYKDQEVLNEIKQTGIPTIVVLIAARPLIVTNFIDNWDAFLVAWVPGTEGEGVSDIIFGDYNPTGKLSFTWPKNMSQIPINYGDKDYDPLFPFGYGLNY